MHIPDGFLDVKTFSILDILSTGFAVIAVKKISKRIGEKSIPLIGVLSAFIFASQMLNFPVGAGTSGHFMGGVLVSILLGPFAGFLAMFTVLIVQCLLFQDGGLLALGANIFNMAIVGSVAGYFIFTFFHKFLKNIFACAFIASFISVILSAGCCAIELSISGIAHVGIILPAMLIVHFFIGLAEGFITALILTFISRLRPDLLEIEKI